MLSELWMLPALYLLNKDFTLLSALYIHATLVICVVHKCYPCYLRCTYMLPLLSALYIDVTLVICVVDLTLVICVVDVTRVIRVVDVIHIVPGEGVIHALFTL